MPRKRGQRRIAARWFCILIGFFLMVLAVPSFLFFRQHAMIYHPRPYDSRYGVKLPANGVEINYTVSAGKCSAFYIPSRDVLPKRLWIAFCGNGSLALDWLANILVNYPVNDDAFLLVDYPGYGKNAGYAMIGDRKSTRLNSSHVRISYAVFCLKKKKKYYSPPWNRRRRARTLHRIRP